MDLEWKHIEEADIPPGFSVMKHMHKDHGDLKIIWDPHNPDEVAAARAQFDALKAKRYFAYTVNKKGDKGEVIKEFDPTAEKIILSLPMQGG